MRGGGGGGVKYKPGYHVQCKWLRFVVMCDPVIPPRADNKVPAISSITALGAQIKVADRPVTQQGLGGARIGTAMARGQSCFPSCVDLVQ